jgi:hypothetical protein
MLSLCRLLLVSDDAKTKPALTILLSANAEYDIAFSIKFDSPMDI